MSKQPQPLRAFGRADAEEGAQRPAGGIGLGPVRGRHGVLAIPIAGIRIEAFARAMAARFCAIAPCARYQCRWRYGSRRHCVNVIRHGNRQSLALTFRRIEFPFSYSSSPVARIEQSEIRERQQRRHCEERSDEAIQRFAAALDCFAELVIGPATSGRTRWLAMTTKRNHSRDASASELCDHQATTKASFRMRLRPRMIPKSGVRFSDKIMRRKEGAKRRKAHPTNGTQLPMPVRDRSRGKRPWCASRESSLSAKACGQPPVLSVCANARADFVPVALICRFADIDFSFADLRRHRFSTLLPPDRRGSARHKRARMTRHIEGVPATLNFRRSNVRMIRPSE